MASDIVIDEPTLIKLAAAGDCAAFGEIYTHYLDAIYRFIFYRVSDKHDAEDLTEQVFIKAWQALPEYKDQGLKLSSWLYRIAQNTVIDFHRKRAATASIEQDFAKDEGNLPAQLVSQQRDLEEESALAQAIARLTDEQQQIILLRFIEGLSHAEVAQIMGKTEGACRMLQNRALVALQQELNGLQ